MLNFVQSSVNRGYSASITVLPCSLPGTVLSDHLFYVFLSKFLSIHCSIFPSLVLMQTRSRKRNSPISESWSSPLPLFLVLPASPSFATVPEYLIRIRMQFPRRWAQCEQWALVNTMKAHIPIYKESSYSYSSTRFDLGPYRCSPLVFAPCRTIAGVHNCTRDLVGWWEVQYHFIT